MNKEDKKLVFEALTTIFITLIEREVLNDREEQYNYRMYKKFYDRVSSKYLELEHDNSKKELPRPLEHVVAVLKGILHQNFVKTVYWCDKSNVWANSYGEHETYGKETVISWKYEKDIMKYINGETK